MTTRQMALRLRRQGLHKPCSFSRATFATAAQTSPKKLSNDDSSSSDAPNPQAFVTTRFTPGEYSTNSTVYPHRYPKDPFYRPPWINKANIISAEDYANQPRVTFEEEYESMHDAMIVLSWLSERQRQDMYDMYCQMMVKMEKEYQTSSHEYVMQVIAKKFNITANRVAAIVASIHDEEQFSKSKEGYNKVHPELQQLADARIQQHIHNCYAIYEEENPNQFVEEPLDSGGLERTQGFISVPELYDVDQLTREAIVREKDEAQHLMDSRIYIEDIREENIKCKVNAECLKLIKRNNEELKLVKDLMAREVGSAFEYPMPERSFGEEDEEDDEDEEEDAAGTKKAVERRPRWKWVAQLVNVRQTRKNGKKSRRGGKLLKRKHYKENSITEHNGVLRVSTMDEVKGVAWKPERNVMEFLCKDLKAAWLRRIHDGETDGWGRVPENKKYKPGSEEEEEVEESSDEYKEEDDGLFDDEDEK